MKHNGEKILNKMALVSGIFLITSFELMSSGYDFSSSIGTLIGKEFYVKNSSSIEKLPYKNIQLYEEAVEEKPYTEEELDMLSRIIFAEAGSDCITDEHQQLVGAVVMNRIADPRFPNTMKEVIWAKGQYACVQNGTYYLTPSERAIENARKVLSGEVVTPSNLVFQAEFIQGKVYKTFETPYSTTYFCLG